MGAHWEDVVFTIRLASFFGIARMGTFVVCNANDSAVTLRIRDVAGPIFAGLGLLIGTVLLQLGPKKVVGLRPPVVYLFAFWFVHLERPGENVGCLKFTEFAYHFSNG